MLWRALSNWEHFLFAPKDALLIGCWAHQSISCSRVNHRRVELLLDKNLWLISESSTSFWLVAWELCSPGRVQFFCSCGNLTREIAVSYGNNQLVVAFSIDELFASESRAAPTGSGVSTQNNYFNRYPNVPKACIRDCNFVWTIFFPIWKRG